MESQRLFSADPMRAQLTSWIGPPCTPSHEAILTGLHSLLVNHRLLVVFHTTPTVWLPEEFTNTSWVRNKSWTFESGWFGFFCCIGILRKLNLKEEEVTKVSTGGPDGDLGSNEIKISKDITIGIVDGSGVLFDPKGINRTEIRRLAEARIMTQHFNRALLSPEGFFISVDDKDVKLPNGELVESGLNFRNNFHLHPLASGTLLALFSL